MHWVGINAKPKNILHKLVQKVASTEKNMMGATAWYNIRPVNPQIHNDIDSYCTSNGKTYYPSILPERTYIYYVKAPTHGGLLRLESGETVDPKVNRLINFPINLSHQVLPYEGNRVSIGFIYWPEVPIIYGKVTSEETKIFDRIWEIEDRRK